MNSWCISKRRLHSSSSLQFLNTNQCWVAFRRLYSSLWSLFILNFIKKSSSLAQHSKSTLAFVCFFSLHCWFFKNLWYSSSAMVSTCSYWRCNSSKAFANLRPVCSPHTFMAAWTAAMACSQKVYFCIVTELRQTWVKNSAYLCTFGLPIDMD